MYVIQGYTGNVAMWRNRSPCIGCPLPRGGRRGVRLPHDALPAIVVYVDAWSKYGGSQFVILRALAATTPTRATRSCPARDARYRTLPDPAHRAIMGKSSGGFGAMITPMLRPDLFGALATHAGGQAVRVRLPGPRSRRPSKAPAPLRRRHLALVAGLLLAGGLHQGRGHGPAGGARRGGVLPPRSRTVP